MGGRGRKWRGGRGKLGEEVERRAAAAGRESGVVVGSGGQRSACWCLVVREAQVLTCVFRVAPTRATALPHARCPQEPSVVVGADATATAALAALARAMDAPLVAGGPRPGTGASECTACGAGW